MARRARAGRRTRAARSGRIAVGAGPRVRVRLAAGARRAAAAPRALPDAPPARHRWRSRVLVPPGGPARLERLEGAQRAPELGHGRAAVAQQRLETSARRCRRLATGTGLGPRSPTRRPSRASPSPPTALLHPPFRRPPGPPAQDARRRPRAGARARAGARPAPGSQHRPPRSVRSVARQLLDQRRLEIGELSRILVRQQHVLLGARMPCFSAFRAATASPSGVFGPRDCAPFLRLASARALDTEPRGATARSGHGGISCYGVGVAESARLRRPCLKCRHSRRP